MSYTDYFFFCPEWRPRHPPSLDEQLSGNARYSNWQPHSCTFQNADGHVINQPWDESSPARVRYYRDALTCTTHGCHPEVLRRRHAFDNRVQDAMNRHVIRRAVVNPDSPSGVRQIDTFTQRDTPWIVMPVEHRTGDNWLSWVWLPARPQARTAHTDW